jgi:restriction endonuclease Mrr
MSRLIARLRHRQFGVFVTTSYFARQAYEEVRADAHPVVLICGRDIVDILEQNHVSTPSEARDWLHANYSQSP